VLRPVDDEERKARVGMVEHVQGRGLDGVDEPGKAPRIAFVAGSTYIDPPVRAG
jgi:hypothetical protein